MPETGGYPANPRDAKRAMTTDHAKQPTREHTAASTTSDEDSGRIGTIGLVCSILGVVTCGLWLLSIPGLVRSIIAMRHGRSGKAKAGVVFYFQDHRRGFHVVWHVFGLTGCAGLCAAVFAEVGRLGPVN